MYFFVDEKKKLEVTFFSVQNYKTCWVLCKGGWGRFLQFSYLLGRISQREVWLDFWAMNKVLSGHIWVVAVPSRQASGLLCLWRAAQGPLGLPFLSQNSLQGGVTMVPCNMVVRSWDGLFEVLARGRAGLVPVLREPGWLLQLWAVRDAPTALLAWPPLSWGHAIHHSHTTRAGRMESASPSLSSQLEISARGFSQDVLGYPSGVSLCPPAPPSLEGLLVGQASRGPEGVVDTQCSVPHAEPRVFQPWFVSTSPITCLCGCHFQFYLFFSFFFTSHLGSVASCSEAQSQLQLHGRFNRIYSGPCLSSASLLENKVIPLFDTKINW